MAEPTSLAIAARRIALGGALLLPLGVRHLWVWGGGLAPVLNAAEALGAFALAVWMARTLAAATTEASLAGPSTMAPDRRGPVGTVVLVGALFVLLPHFLSDDVRDYLMRGRLLAVHGANPYLQTAADFPDDPYMHAYLPGLAGPLPVWTQMRCPYGPLAAEIQGGVALIAEGVRRLGGTHLSIAAGLLLFKLLGWLCLAGTACAARTAWKERDAAQGTLAWYALALSPFLLLELAGMAHNDAWMVLPAAWAVTLTLRGRTAFAAVALVVAAAIKPPVVLLWPLLAGHARRRGRLATLLLSSTLAAAAVGVYAWLRFFQDPEALTVFRQQAGITRTSLRLFLGLGLERLGAPGPAALARWATLGAFLLLYARWVVHAWRGRAELPALCLKALLAAGFLALGLTNAWYLAWAFPFAWYPGAEAWRPWASRVNLFAPASYGWHLLTRTFALVHQAIQLVFLLLPLLPGSARPGRSTPE